MVEDTPEFGSLREAFTIKMRPFSSNSQYLSDFNPLDAQESIKFVKERRILYASAWMDMESEIEEIRESIDREAIDQLKEFVVCSTIKDQMSYNLLTQIPTAIVMGGYNSPDQDEFYDQVCNTEESEDDIVFAKLASLDGSSLKECMKRTLDQLMPENVSTKSAFSDFDIERLLVARKEARVTSKMAIVIPQFESFPHSVLEKLIKIFLGRIEELPICLIVGISTTIETFYQSLSKSVISCLNTRIFQLHQSQEAVNRIVQKLLVESPECVKLDHSSYSDLLDRFHQLDLSLKSFVRGLKFSIMCHFYGNPLSILSPKMKCTYESLSTFHYDQVRMLPSFREFVENMEDGPGAVSFYRSLLCDDQALFEFIVECLIQIKNHNIKIALAVKSFGRLQRLISKSKLKSLRTIYSMTLSGALVEKNFMSDCTRLFRILPHKEKIDFFKALLNDMIHNKDIFQEETDIIVELLMLTEDEMADETMDEDEVEETSDFANRQMDSEFRKAEVKRSTKTAMKAGSHELDENSFRFKIQSGLTKFFQSVTKSYKDLPLHELMYYSDTSLNLENSLSAQPIQIMRSALCNPAAYLDCRECSDVMHAHLPDACILFKLYLEAGKLINLRDWYEGFKVIIEYGGEEFQCDESVLEARFSKGIEELKFLGYIKKTGRKTDHVQKQIEIG